MAGLFQNINAMNPFAKFFIVNKEHSDISRQTFEDQNAQGISANQYENILQHGSIASYGGGYDQQTIDFSPTIDNKKARTACYRQIALSPEIDDGITNITNDATQRDQNGFIYEIKFLDRSSKNIPDIVKQRIKNAYEYLYYEIMDFNTNAQELFKRFLVDGEVYIEWILNDKGTNIIGYQLLPCFTMVPIYADRGNKVKGFIQMLKDGVTYNQTYNGDNTDNAKLFQSNQISYVAYPGAKGSTRIDVRGYLEPAMRYFNLLRSVEDAIVTYRLVRAPERRVWNIYAGGLPPAKVGEYINGLQRKYKKKMVFDSNTGTVDQATAFQSVLEDFWFAKDASGNTSTVDTLPSGMNLGEITDLDYLQKKLYKSLKLPTSRWADPAAQYTGGKIGEVTREEVRFAHFVNNLQEIFKNILKEPLFLLCKMRGIDEKYISSALIDLTPTVSNYFKEYLHNDIIATKLAVFTSVADKIWSPETPADTFAFHADTVLEDLCGFTKDFIEKNKERISEAMKNIVKEPESVDGIPPDDGSGSEVVPEESEDVSIPDELPPEANPDSIPEPEDVSAEEVGMQSGEESDFE